MKKIFTYKLLAIFIVLIASCDNGFDDLNRSKVNATAIDPILQLNFAAMNSSFHSGGGGGGPLIYDMGIVQQLISPNSGVITGANYNQDNRDATATLWQNYYRNVIRNTRDVVRVTAGQPDRTNLYHMGRILQAYAFMVLTDEYGDIPYSEAGHAYPDTVLFPIYEQQEIIYQDIIKELTEASAALDPAVAPEPVDLLYGGDITKWKKFGYSILLRAGMRLSQVNPIQAASIVQTAFEGGVMTSNGDNARIRHDANYVNGLGNTLNGSESSNFYLTEPFVNYLKNTNDPRLSSIAVRYKGATSGPEQTVSRQTTVAADQIGMPMGHNNSTIVPVATDLGLASFYDFSQVDRRRLVKRDAPMFLVTAAQTQLLLAEASFRGWITTGTPTEYFAAGIRAHMEQMGSFDAGAAVPADAIDTYLAEHPLIVGTELEQINTQYWVASFLNGPEAFANFRRSGYPALTPNPFPGKTITGDFIVRLTYPNSEISVNTKNVDEAIARMGADDLDTRVWWDLD